MNSLGWTLDKSQWKGHGLDHNQKSLILTCVCPHVSMAVNRIYLIKSSTWWTIQFIEFSMLHEYLMVWRLLYLAIKTETSSLLAPLMNVLFWVRCFFPISFSGRNMSRNVWNWKIVGTEILSNNMKSPSPKRYMAFLSIYSDTLHLSDITPIFDPVTELSLITEFDFLSNCARFP